MLYSAIVKDKESKRRIVIREQEYPNKSEFIHDLRHDAKIALQKLLQSRRSNNLA